MERWLFVVNPAAGKGRAAERWKRYRRYLRGLPAEWEIYHTRYPGDAKQMAQRVAAERAADVMVAVGGDGTIHEIIQGLAGSRVALGILPAGTGNDVARHLGIRKGRRGLEQLVRSVRTPVDLVRLEDGVFLNMAGTGFDATVAERVNDSGWLKRWGPAGYALGVIAQLAAFEPQRVRVVVDGREYTYISTWMVVIGNGSTYAGGMRLLPHASIEDGELDLCVVDGMTKPKFCRLFPTVFLGKHVGVPGVHLLKGRRIAVYPERPWPVHADGEIMPRRGLEARVWPGALFLMRPPL
ncbi:MAG: diacylglycerol kinase family lipid kinase [Alicyclobacillaceae bacterium]|nr:diacylglycerol kinase family lipid kinase [Alicyclobacillaceae bacterium]